MATKGAKQEAFDKPSKIKFIQVSKKAGKLPSKHTPPKDLKTEVFASFATPTEYDNSYKMVKIDKVSKKLATEYTPEAAIEEKAFFEHHAILPNNANWEDAVRKWAEENNEDDIAPTEYDDVHTAATNKEKPSVIIKTPTNLSIVSPPSVGILVDVSSKSGINYVEYYWDGALIDTSRLSPYKGVINIPKGTKNGSEHTIKAIVYDAVYNTNQSSISVKVDKDTIAPIMKFIYPGDGIGVSVGSSIPIHADAYDTNGDISRVEFYIDGKLKYTDRVTPYIWQFIVPQTPGVYTIHATAYDYANNKTQSTIILNAKEPSPTAQSGNSRIIEPYKNQSFNAGKNILIQVALNKKDRANLKELIVTARKKGKIIKVAETKSSASAYTFIWNKVHAGTYDLQFKTVLKDGKMRFSERVPVVVR